ncbi:MAG: DUF4388 domain-containing protein [Myxococcota bacterium]
MTEGGAIPDDGIVGVLRTVEAQSTTGVLRFQGPQGEAGEVALLRGQIAADQPEGDSGVDPVEVLLALRGGRYALEQRLLPLPVSRGDHRMRSGSLVVHVPADLMNYCERAGLTGLLTLEQDGRRAEIVYARGDLEGIRLDGLDQLHQVFSWESGKFRVEAHAQVPSLDVALDDADDADPFDEADTTEFQRPARKAPRGETTTGTHFLRVVEMELAEILREREERRPATKTSPPLPPLGAVRAPESYRPPDAAADAAALRREREPTVKVVFLAKGAPDAPVPDVVAPPPPETSPRPQARRPPRDPVAEALDEELPDVAPEAPAPAPAVPAAEGHAKQAPTALWALVALLVCVLALALLAALPALDG